ncbi:MAG: CoA pyrophosphatase [Anaerolineaceae bacterium]
MNDDKLMDYILDNLTTEQVIARLKPNSPQEFLNDQSAVRRAGVLVPLIKANGEWQLIFTRRTDMVNDHKGQVSFPGGMAEPGDIKISTTAVREAWEEIGLKPGNIQILGYLADFHTVTDFLITPVVGFIEWPFEIILSPNEVARVFTVPMKWLLDHQNWEERSLTIGDRCLDNVVFYRDYDGEVLWGVTAKITLNLLQALNLL